MRKYTPFLKMKVNELAAIEQLPKDALEKICPFFDLPHKADRTEAELISLIKRTSNKMRKLSKIVPTFFLDLYDIPDALLISGASPFYYLTGEFNGLDFVPVIGLDRTNAYLDAVMVSRLNALVVSKIVAIRLVQDDFQSYAAIKSDLDNLLSSAKAAGFESFILVIDMRVCGNQLPADLAKVVERFIAAISVKKTYSEIIVCGSSIPAQIGELVDTESELHADRHEIEVFKLLNGKFKADDVGFGDYTIVSPNYSDVTLPPELLRNVTAPKICYTYNDVHFIARGGALKTHKRGSLQYNDMAVDLVKRSFFRKAGYSFGEDFLIEKAKMQGKECTPSSVLKPTICTHMTYMVRDHPLFV